MHNSTCCLASGLLISASLFSAQAEAQIIADPTTNTQVNLEDNTWEITGGETLGKNLFHSFEQFSITQDNTAWFNNATDLNNIFGRVTGSSVSEISGLIRSMGTANLFLINPNGIVFNQGAALDVGGSFMATTADRLLFDDGAEFSAVAPDTKPLLTISSPVGLQLGKNAGAIAVNGRGHNLADGTLNNPFIRQANLDELRVQPGNNIALIGGEITFNGGVLVAEEGAIDLIGLRDRQIDLNADLAIADLNEIDSIATNNFGNIDLEQKSLLDASGISGGSINVIGGNINLTQNSHVLIQKFQGEQEQAIDILASETFSLTNGSALTTENLDSGSTAAINVAANNLVLDEGGNISALAYQDSYGRDIKIDVAQDVRVTGFNPFDLDFPSVVAGVSLSTGKAPNVSLSAQNLSLENGGNVASAAFNIGSGGNVDIEIENAIAISGTSSIFLPSGISAITGGVGSGGDLSINTGSLTVENSGIINTATVRGNSGNLTIDAREYVRVSGFNPSASLSSTITSSVEEELA
ncbi:MAG: filamentous hemagglutinin N-terminal domain-containing protein, partial [Cyanobacteria bacterium J06582_2]